MSETWTIRRILEWISKDFASRGIDSPRVDAELLVAESLGIERVRMYMDLERPLAPSELADVRAKVTRRRSREPVAYILGRRDFYGATYAVDSRVLVPRPDTEVVVERTLAAIGTDREARVLDLCTGSGAIPVAILRVRPNATAVATDVSQDALAVATTNAESLGVLGRFEARQGDLFAPIEADERFDAITANPPYIPTSDLEGLMPEVAKFEPRLALDGGADGLVLYPRLAAGAAIHLVDGGFFALELGMGQAASVAAIVQATGCFEEVAITKDYGGVERVVSARRRPR